MTDNPFWTFSLALYSRKPVADYCLALQESFDADVNLLLFCCWLGCEGRLLEPGHVEFLVAEVRPLRKQLILPLRRRRQLLDRTGDQAQRRQLLSQELAAEQAEQQRLYTWYCRQQLPATSVANGVASNLAVYFESLGLAAQSDSPLVEICQSALWLGR